MNHFWFLGKKFGKKNFRKFGQNAWGVHFVIINIIFWGSKFLGEGGVD
jgi:hypothetical protein